MPSNAKISGYGEIGRHARFRFWCRKAWEFKSLYPHQKEAVNGENPAGPDLSSAAECNTG